MLGLIKLCELILFTLFRPELTPGPLDPVLDLLESILFDFSRNCIYYGVSTLLL